VAGVEEGNHVCDGKVISPCACDKPLVGAMRFACGYLSPYFVTDPEGALDNILVHEKAISSKKDLLPQLEQITKSGKPLLNIDDDDVEGDAPATLVVNKLGGTRILLLWAIQKTLAEMVGTRRSRVSFFMNRFSKLGFIESNGGTEVHSPLLHVMLHDR
jgi:hypothetical protein